MIFSTLKRGSWRRKAPRPDSPKRALYEARLTAARAAKARDKALTNGCEYAAWLRAWWKVNGCAACGRHRGVVLHHVRHRSQKGRAEWQVPLCPIPCHVEDARGIEGKAWEDHGVDLHAKAEELASEARALPAPLLPVECCEQCGVWHSKGLMLDAVDKAAGITQRICAECAPEGPP